MTGNEMLSTLGLRLEDPQESSFTQAAKLDSLNIAQRSVVNLVHNSYLVELQTIVANQAMVDYSVTYAVLTTENGQPIRNGIIAVKLNGGKWATMIEPGDQKRLENTYLTGSATNPVSYVFGEKVYVDGAATATTAIDVWYLRQPLAFVSASAVTNVSQLLAAECEMNVAMHEVVVDLAESQLWKMDAKVDRANAAFANAKAQVDALNARYPSEAPSGIGTKGRA
jgi:hypothetical protein